MNKKDFKNLLTEWKNLVNNNLLLEISRNEVIEVIGKDDYSILKNNKKAAQDQNFLKVIINTYKANQNHSITDILGLYQDYERFIKEKWNQGKTADVHVPGGLKDSLEPDTTTYDNMFKFIDASASMILKTKVFIKCLDQDDVNPDFEVVLNDNEWIICYPKTIKGSISLARSFWNGEKLEYDTTISGGVGQNIGRMNWCTSIVSGGNMFLNYHRQKNLHMYYCIKKNMNIEDPDRKLCISFNKQDDEVWLDEGGTSSVNAENDMTDETTFKKYIGSRFNVLLKDAEKPERLEIDEISYYKSISLEQYKILRAANEDMLENFAKELHMIIEYSEDKRDIILSALKDKRPELKIAISRSNTLLDLDPTGNLIVKLSQDINSKVRSNIAGLLLHPKAKKIKQVDELIKILSQDSDENVRAVLAKRSLDYLLLDKLLLDESPKVKAALASRSDLQELDPELIKRLAQDKSSEVRLNLAKNPKLRIFDPSGELIKQLAQDENSEIKILMIIQYRSLLTNDLIKQLSQDKDAIVRQQIACIEDIPADIANQLAQDEDAAVRKYVAPNKNLSGELIKQLAEDKNANVRAATVQHHGYTLLELDPELIKQLAQDESEWVRNNSQFYYNYYLRFPKKYTNESVLRKYIKYYMTKG